MRILIISERFYPEGGGAEVVTYEITRWLLSRGHDIIVLTGTPAVGEVLLELRKATSISRAKLKYIYADILRLGKKVWYWSIAPILLHKISDMLKSVDIVYIPGIHYTLIPLLKRIEKDIYVIVHLHNFQPLTYSQFFIDIDDDQSLFRLDLKLLSIEYGVKSYALAPIIPLLLRIIRTSLLYSDKIIVPTYSYKYRIESNLPALAKKTKVLYNPIFENNMPRLRDIVMSKERVVVYLGGKRYIKGPKIALAISKYIVNKFRGSKAFLVGFSNNLIIQYSNNSNNSRLIMLPRVSRDRAKYIIRKGRVLLFPSIIMEPCPNVMLEALSLGTIPVAFVFDTVRELVRSTKAEKYLCKPYDISCMVKRVEEVLSLDYIDYRDIAIDILVKLNQRFDKHHLLKQLEYEICCD